MSLNGAVSIIWLDAHIGLNGECESLKESFRIQLVPAAAMFPVPRDPIDEMICCIAEFAAPIVFMPSVTDAFQYIETDIAAGKQVILITSGSLAKDIISKIQQENMRIHSCYIFCANIMNYVEWASEYITDGLDMMMFDFPLDLLVRLSRDLSKELIERGKPLLVNDPQSALNYFQCARTLAENAVKLDTPKDSNDMHRPSTKHREVLDGKNGLIAQAERACNTNAS